MGGGCTHAQSLAEVVKVVFVQQYNVVFVVIIAQFLDRGGEQWRRVKLQLFKKSFPCFAHCAEDRGVWWGGREEGHAGSSFLLPVRTLSGIQPELINSNRPPHYPGCNGPRAGGWPVGNTGGGEGGGKYPPNPLPPQSFPTTTPPHTHTHTLSVLHQPVQHTQHSHCFTLKQ